jgi:2-isopropylmalate synthase
VDRAWEAVRHAERNRIHIFLATSELHMKKKLRMTHDQVKEEVAASVARAKGYTDDVEYSPEDGFRSDPDFMCDVCQIAVDNGATTINIPDTVGFGLPEDFGGLIAYVIERVRGEFVVSTHCHNDLGLAVANSLAGVASGARQVECAINGLGERAGNAALEEIVMAIRTRADYFDGITTGVRTEELARASRMVSRLTGYPVQYNKAVVGRNAFAHEAGIHQHGVLEDPATYEIMDAGTVGQEAAQIVLGKHSGRHAFADSLEKMGLHLQGDALNQAFVRFKELADRKVQITEADLEAIVAEELGTGVVHKFSVVSLVVRGGTESTPTATVVLSDGDGKVDGSGEGNGMIDAAIAAIADATRVSGTLTDFNVSSVTGGGDALGDVVVQLEVDGLQASGRGVATDVVEASARAYLAAVNRIIRMRERPPRDTVVGP